MKNFRLKTSHVPLQGTEHRVGCFVPTLLLLHYFLHRISSNLESLNCLFDSDCFSVVPWNCISQYLYRQFKVSLESWPSWCKWVDNFETLALILNRELKSLPLTGQSRLFHTDTYRWTYAHLFIPQGIYMYPYRHKYIHRHMHISSHFIFKLHSYKLEENSLLMLWIVYSQGEYLTELSQVLNDMT